MSRHQTVFISYGGADTAFASQLNDRLESHGIRTWFFPKHAVPGTKLHVAMRQGVNFHDRVLAICSRTAFKRKGFRNELELTVAREAREGGASILIPIAIDDFLFSGVQPMEGGHLQEILDRVVGDFQEAASNPAAFERGFERLLIALTADLQDSLSDGDGPVVEPPRGAESVLAGDVARLPIASSPLIIEYQEGQDPFLMRWDGQSRTIQGNEFHYTHRVFRVSVRNTSEHTVRGVQVVLSDVRGVESRHPSILSDHRLRVMGPNTAEANINPGSSVFFDVASHDLEPEIHAIDDLKFRYADAEKESLPTDPGTWWDFGLQAQGMDVLPVTAHFRLFMDPSNVAQMVSRPTPERLGIEASFERRLPFEDDDYIDTAFGEGGKIFRIGLRSMEVNRPYRASVVLESVTGGIAGARLERPFRIKDTTDGSADVPYANRACTFVDILKFPTLGNRKPSLLYAQVPDVRNDLELTSSFTLRFRITGGPRATHLSLSFVPNILGFPEVQTYEAE